MPVTVTFRFYEELNFFLKKEFRKHSFDRTFNESPAVKDAIESLGVPHTEVDLILVNGLSVDFSYRIRTGDYISVYPMFESFEIGHLNPLREHSLRNPRFVLDVHLGKLTRYLRLVGFDCLYRRDLNDNEIIEISVTEKRIVFTRDLGILKNKRVTHGYYLRSDNAKEQFREVVERLDLTSRFQPFSRCMMCNGEIVEVDKDSIVERLESLTRTYYSVFYRCQSCGRIYWEGSHFIKLQEFLKSAEKEWNTDGTD